MDIPIVKPINEINYEFKQSKYSNVPKVPLRALIFGPSGSGKSVLLVSLILDIYRNVFQRVYVFSPSVNHDSIWLPVKKYVKDELKVNEDKEKCFFEEYKGEDLMKIIDTQTKVTNSSPGAQMEAPARLDAGVRDCASSGASGVGRCLSQRSEHGACGDELRCAGMWCRGWGCCGGFRLGRVRTAAVLAWRYSCGVHRVPKAL